MIITAMYIYGIIHGSWKFGFDMAFYFLLDVVLVRLLSLGIRVNVMIKTSDEEKNFWRKKTEVEELKRVSLDRELYGKR